MQLMGCKQITLEDQLLDHNLRNIVKSFDFFQLFVEVFDLHQVMTVMNQEMIHIVVVDVMC